MSVAKRLVEEEPARKYTECETQPRQIRIRRAASSLGHMDRSRDPHDEFETPPETVKTRWEAARKGRSDRH
jgi:hypothetical protein